MAFGAGYTAKESTPNVGDGIHDAVIVEVKPVENDWGKHLEIKFKLNGLDVCYPNTYFMYDRPDKPFGNFTLEACQDMWDKTVTNFFKNFGIPTEEKSFRSFNSWVGKSGKVTVRPQKKNPDYKEIVPYPMQQKNKPEEQKPVPASAPASGDFPEDIPF